MNTLDEMDGADDCAKNPVVPTPLRPWESVSAMDPVEAWDVDWFRLVEVDEQTLSPADRGRRKELVELAEHIQAQRYSVREIRAMQERIRWLEERLSDLESAAKETLADPSAPRLRLLIDLADLANPGNKP